ncbi:MAG: hypothetical protein ACSLE2_01135 [Lysobacterales bacterium]
MSGQDLSDYVYNLQTDVLDHAREFVELVYRQAPVEYQHLLSSERFAPQLENDPEFGSELGSGSGSGHGGTFNHGKLYAYAEFTVFRREFADRFPDASAAACINAFSSLFLKNDISIHNLIEYVEGADDREQLRLNSPS